MAQGDATLYSDKDAVIGIHPDINSENTNYDYADWYGALSQPGSMGGENNSRALIYFDLGQYPPGTVIDEATMDLFGRGAVGLGDAAAVGNIGANSCWLEHVVQNWSDDAVTWNTQPSVTPMNAVLIPPSTQLIEDYVGLDVTAMVQAMINDPSQAHGFLIRTQIEDPTRGLFFCGNSYTNPDRRPRLNIKADSDISVFEFAQRPGLRLSPNPVLRNQPVHLTLPENMTCGSIKVIDLCGRSIDEIPVRDPQRGVVLSTDLPPGRYCLLVTDNAGVEINHAELVVLE